MAAGTSGSICWAVSTGIERYSCDNPGRHGYLVRDRLYPGDASHGVSRHIGRLRRRARDTLMSSIIGTYCDFCQITHSSNSCYPPGRKLLEAAEAERDRLRAENAELNERWGALAIEIENMTDALPGDEAPTLEQVLAAVKLVCDR